MSQASLDSLGSAPSWEIGFKLGSEGHWIPDKEFGFDFTRYIGSKSLRRGPIGVSGSFD